MRGAKARELRSTGGVEALEVRHSAYGRMAEEKRGGKWEHDLVQLVQRCARSTRPPPPAVVRRPVRELDAEAGRGAWMDQRPVVERERNGMRGQKRAATHLTARQAQSPLPLLTTAAA